MAQTIIIPNPKKYRKKLFVLRKEGAQKLHILADFEKTLTYAYVGTKEIPSIISVLRENTTILGESYAKKAKKLFEKYHPIEINPAIPISQKKKAMEEWWRKHFELLIRYGLNKHHLIKVVKSGRIRLRRGIKTFLKLLHLHKIPIVIMSASGLGAETISLFLKENNCLYSNIYIVSNSFVWDEQGRAVGIKEPIIHSLNKEETSLKSFTFFKKIQNRKNVILLGDKIEDIEMVKGFSYVTLLSISFFNYKNRKDLLKHYEKVYDVILTGDCSMIYINKLIKHILGINNEKRSSLIYKLTKL